MKEEDLTVLSVKKKRKSNGVPFVKGDPRINKNGRPKGSLSVIGRLKQMWAEDPDDFEMFVKQYRKDKMNSKHIAEMIDGKPRQNIGLDGGGEGIAIQFANVFNKENE